MSATLQIIAEAGVNHNGSVERALQMVDVAAEAGADYIKFQTFSADRLAQRDAKLADYQRESDSDSRTQWDLLRGLELSHEEFAVIRDRCKTRQIGFLSTGFDLEELQFLINDLEIPIVKIASGDITFAPLLLDAGKSGLPTILSTGMANLEEIESALKVLALGYAIHAGVVDGNTSPREGTLVSAWSSAEVQSILRSKVTVLHCTTQYPADLNALNLRAIGTIAQAFGLPVGYSDHSLGSLGSVVAVTLGATVIEKHFTLDKALDGPDHAASLDPDELREFIAELRSVGVVLGSRQKECQPQEVANRAVVRRSLVAARAVGSGQLISVDDVECRRPGAGRSAAEYWNVVGSLASSDYAVGDYFE